MKFKKLTKNQKKCQKELLREIQNAKTQAKVCSHGIKHKYVIIATRNIQELYSYPRFCKNYNFLLRRYIKLEHASNIWLLIFLPILLSMLYDYCVNRLIPLPQQLLSELLPIMNPSSDVQVSILSILVILFFFVLLVGIIACSFVRLAREIINSVSRTPESTILENELNIIKQLLVDNHILIE